MRSNIIDITVQKLHETSQAVLVTEGTPEEGVWLPKSQIEIEENRMNSALYDVSLPEWLAKEKGLI